MVNLAVRRSGAPATHASSATIDRILTLIDEAEAKGIRPLSVPPVCWTASWRLLSPLGASSPASGQATAHVGATDGAWRAFEAQGGPRQASSPRRVASVAALAQPCGPRAPGMRPGAPDLAASRTMPTLRDVTGTSACVGVLHWRRWDTDGRLGLTEPGCPRLHVTRPSGCAGTARLTFTDQPEVEVLRARPCRPSRRPRSVRLSRSASSRPERPQRPGSRTRARRPRRATSSRPSPSRARSP